MDLAGGTLDIWPLGVLHPGARTVNVAIDLEAQVEITPRDHGYELVAGKPVSAQSLEELAELPEGALIGTVAGFFDLPPATIRVESSSPRSAGLGGSSAVAVALIAACEHALGSPESPPERRGTLARDLEARLMGLPTGRQDHFPALLGGALDIRHQPGGEEVRRIDTDLESLGDCLHVAYSGQSHFSAGNNWQVVKRRLDGDPESIELFSGITEVAAQTAHGVAVGDWPHVGALMTKEWKFRRRLAEEVSTPKLEELLTSARAAGAWGGKACGAGGGGCVVALAPPERREQVAEALSAAGGELLPARPSGRPVRTRSISG